MLKNVGHGRFITVGLYLVLTLEGAAAYHLISQQQAIEGTLVFLGWCRDKLHERKLRELMRDSEPTKAGPIT